MTALRLVILLLVFGAVGVPGPALSAKAVGEVTKLKGAAVAIANDKSRPLKVGESLLDIDTVKTEGPASRLVVKLLDGTELTLGGNASLKIETFDYEPGAGRGALTVRQLAGPFLFVGGDVENQKTAAVQIKTEAATLGVRGTTVWGGPQGLDFGVLLLDGKVTVTTESGAVELDEAGEGTGIENIKSKGVIAGFRIPAPKPPRIWAADEVNRALAEVALE